MANTLLDLLHDVQWRQGQTKSDLKAIYDWYVTELGVNPNATGPLRQAMDAAQDAIDEAVIGQPAQGNNSPVPGPYVTGTARLRAVEQLIQQSGGIEKVPSDQYKAAIKSLEQARDDLNYAQRVAEKFRDLFRRLYRIRFPPSWLGPLQQEQYEQKKYPPPNPPPIVTPPVVRPPRRAPQHTLPIHLPQLGLGGHGALPKFNVGGMKGVAGSGGNSLPSSGGSGTGPSTGGEGFDDFGGGFGGGQGATGQGTKGGGGKPGGGSVFGDLGGDVGGDVGGDAGHGDGSGGTYAGIGGTGSTDPADSGYADLFSSDNNGQGDGSGGDAGSTYQGIGGTGSTDPADNNYSDLFPKDPPKDSPKDSQPKSTVLPDPFANTKVQPLGDPNPDDGGGGQESKPSIPYGPRHNNVTPHFRWSHSRERYLEQRMLERLGTYGYASGDDLGSAGYNPRFDPDPDSDGSGTPLGGTGTFGGVAPGEIGGDDPSFAGGGSDVAKYAGTAPNGPDPDNEWGAGGYNPHYQPQVGYTWTPSSRGVVGTTRVSAARVRVAP